MDSLLTYREPSIDDGINKEAIRLFYGFKNSDLALTFFKSVNHEIYDSVDSEGSVKEFYSNAIIAMALWHRKLDSPYFSNTIVEKIKNSLVDITTAFITNDSDYYDFKFPPKSDFITKKGNYSHFNVIINEILLYDDPIMGKKSLNAQSKKLASFEQLLVLMLSVLTTQIIDKEFVMDKLLKGDSIVDILGKSWFDNIINKDVTINSTKYVLKDIINYFLTTVDSKDKDELTALSIKELLLGKIKLETENDYKQSSFSDLSKIIYEWKNNQLLSNGEKLDNANATATKLSAKIMNDLSIQFDDMILRWLESIMLQLLSKLNKLSLTVDKFNDYLEKGIYGVIYEWRRMSIFIFKSLDKSLNDLIKNVFDKNDIHGLYVTMDNKEPKMIWDKVYVPMINGLLAPDVEYLWRDSFDIRNNNNEELDIRIDIDLKNARLNLLNMDSLGTKMASEFIPYVNKNNNTILFSSCKTKSPMKIMFSKKENSRSLLKLIYSIIYRNNDLEKLNSGGYKLFLDVENGNQFMNNLCRNYDEFEFNQILNVKDIVEKELKKTIDSFNNPTTIFKSVLEIFDEVYDISTNGTYIYKDDKLYRKDDDGQYTIDVSPGTVNGAKEVSRVCDVAKVKASDCNKFISECMLNNDKDGLLYCSNMMVQMNDTELKLFIENELNNIYPPLALRILQLLGIRKKKVFNEQAQQPIYIVESVTHWLNNFVNNKFDKELQEKIASNKSLLTYVNALVQFVNANPGLLNKGYTGSSINKIQKTYLNLPKRKSDERLVDRLNRLKHYLEMEARMTEISTMADKTLDLMGKNTNYLVPVFMFDNLGGLMNIDDPSLMLGTKRALTSFMGLQFGGNNENAKKIGFDILSGKTLGSHVVLNELYKNVKKELSYENKELDEKLDVKMKKMLEYMKDAEIKIINELNLIKKYIDLFRTYGHYDPEIHELKELNKDQIESFAKENSAHERRFKENEITFVNNLIKIAEKLKIPIEKDDITYEQYENLN